MFLRVFVWVGSRATEEKKKKAMEIAQEYSELAKQKDHKRSNIDTVVIHEGAEDILFKACFHAWEDAPTKTHASRVATPVSTPTRTLSASTPTTVNKSTSTSLDEALKQFNQKYTYDVLINNPPAEVDKSKLELYLLDEEFSTLFGVDRVAFNNLPSWKKLELKKAKKLF
eukprot:TRINITY_DN9299_c0_g1_i1.p1 TRINITY_DN9299_c0_g1~~TRINITY_DN9299_c0_g1_i1.p1  ORF type:complete len:170 (+),score=44.18 TRINITY_DN9299_c0_g1_i1:237-746(+)